MQTDVRIMNETSGKKKKRFLSTKQKQADWENAERAVGAF